MTLSCFFIDSTGRGYGPFHQVLTFSIFFSNFDLFFGNFFFFLKIWVRNRISKANIWSYIGKGITSLCWRPDGKAVAVGLEDGTISLHDVEVSKS